MMVRPPLVATAAAMALLTGAGTAAAQTGAPGRTGPSAALAGGYVEHAVAGGTGGTAFGVDASFSAGRAAVRVGYRRMLLEGGAPDTDALRATVRYPALEMAGVLASAEGHAGVTRFARDTDSGLVVAGGLGLHLTPTVSRAIRPYVSVRGLGGLTTGTALDASYSATAFALGVEAGVGTALGPVDLWLRAARDGFDGGLGATPYPKTTIELSVGVRF